jgi:hypothetical protein
MRTIWLLVLLVSCASNEPRYRTKHDWVGTGGGFMHVEKRDGVIYYYRMEELDGMLKLHLMLHNTTKKPFKLMAKDFSLLWGDLEFYPREKKKIVKESIAIAETMAGLEQKQKLYELTLVDRFMMDEEFQLVPDSPTKTHILFDIPTKGIKTFGMKLGPRSEVIAVERSP